MDEGSENRAVNRWVERLGLEPHPEGGYFRETWRSELVLPGEVLTPSHGGERNAGTSILYLLPSGERSARHRVASDELWLFQAGDPLDLRIEDPDSGQERRVRLGLGEGQQLQALVPAGWWQSAGGVDGEAGYTLVGCVVVPGFDFADFEMADEGGEAR